MNKNVWCLAVWLLAACGQQNNDGGNAGIKQTPGEAEPVGRINNDPPTAWAEKNASEAQKQESQEPKGPELDKGSWGNKHGKRSFLYSAKIDSLVAKKNKSITPYMHQSKDWYSTIDVLSEKFLKTLTAKDLLYYCLAYPAYSSQNCSSFPIPDDGKNYFAQFLPLEQYVSDVQVLCLRQKRDSVCYLLEKVMNENDELDIDILALIHRTNLYEMIPLLCKKAGFKKNPYIYTLFINMMKSNKYRVFTESEYYNQLVENVHPNGSIIAKKTDADSLVKYTMRFYHEQTGR